MPRSTPSKSGTSVPVGAGGYDGDAKTAYMPNDFASSSAWVVSSLLQTSCKATMSGLKRLIVASMPGCRSRQRGPNLHQMFQVIARTVLSTIVSSCLPPKWLRAMGSQARRAAAVHGARDVRRQADQQ